jgi:ABC-type phosphate transport system substrate-binding protein
MGYAKILPIIVAVVLAVSGCMVIESLDQPYEAESGKTFKTTLVARTPEAGEDEEETFAHGVLGVSVPYDWDVEEVKTVEGEIKPEWKQVPPGKITADPGYAGDEGHPWTYFITDDVYSTIEHANMVFTAEVKIKPGSAGYFELGYVSGTTEEPEGGEYAPSWGTNEVNGGQVIFKRIWVK